MGVINLTWTDFLEYSGTTINDLIVDADFNDVTLACDDDQQIAAHKFVLSAGSPFFKNILKKNPHQHPLLYLKGVKFVHLQSIIRFTR